MPMHPVHGTYRNHWNEIGLSIGDLILNHSKSANICDCSLGDSLGEHRVHDARVHQAFAIELKSSACQLYDNLRRCVYGGGPKFLQGGQWRDTAASQIAVHSKQHSRSLGGSNEYAKT